MIRGILSAQLSANDFDAYLAARVLSSEELTRLPFRDLIKVRNAVRTCILTSDTIRKEMRRAAEESLQQIRKAGK